MNKIFFYFLTAVLLLLTISGSSQNVGIGTTTPAFRLDVRTGSINTDSVYRINSLQVLSIKGNGNFFAGQAAGTITTGSFNSFSGNVSGNINTTGSFNAFFGHQSGFDNTIGSSNCFVGANAGNSNSTGSDNCFVGRKSGLFNTTGYSNVAIGSDALHANGIGSNNVAIGDSALHRQISVIEPSVAVGSKAGYSTNTGYANTFVGFQSGYNNADGRINCFIGDKAGITNASGSGNIAIGAGSDVTDPDLTTAVAIGAGARVGCSQCLALGGLGLFATRVGINNEVPVADLHIIQQIDGGGSTSRGIQLQRNIATNNFWRTYVDNSNLLTFEYNNGGPGSWGWINTSGSFVNGSDMRSKKDIQLLEDNIVNKIMLLLPKKYLFNPQNDNEQYSYGFLAQEVQKIFPEFVSAREDGYLGITYSSFSVVAIKAIQEQQLVIDALKKQNEQQQQQYDEMKKEIAELKKEMSGRLK